MCPLLTKLADLNVGFQCDRSKKKGKKGVIKFMAKSTYILGRMPEGHGLGN